jgi:predicted transcriptional regulator
MQRSGTIRDKRLEDAVHDLLKSRARSRIYVYLLKKNGARTEQIIKGTKLHPSTVRETLSQMYNQKLIFRKKIKNQSIGKNPYLYYPISPIALLKKRAYILEESLNKIANITSSEEKPDDYKPVKINIYERVDQT